MVPQLATRCLVLHQCVAPLLMLISRLYVATGQMMPAIFILGDSLTDVGNNNYILTLAKANFPPNGLDFQSGPTGRFCNGRTVPDVIGLSAFSAVASSLTHSAGKRLFSEQLGKLTLVWSTCTYHSQKASNSTSKNPGAVINVSVEWIIKGWVLQLII